VNKQVPDFSAFADSLSLHSDTSESGFASSGRNSNQIPFKSLAILLKDVAWSTTEFVIVHHFQKLKPPENEGTSIMHIRTSDLRSLNLSRSRKPASPIAPSSSTSIPAKHSRPDDKDSKPATPILPKESVSDSDHFGGKMGTTEQTGKSLISIQLESRVLSNSQRYITSNFRRKRAYWTSSPKMKTLSPSLLSPEPQQAVGDLAVMTGGISSKIVSSETSGTLIVRIGSVSMVKGYQKRGGYRKEQTIPIMSNGSVAFLQYFVLGSISIASCFTTRKRESARREVVHLKVAT